MKMLFGLLISLVLTSPVMAEDLPDTLVWVVYCQGDVQKAKIVNFMEAENTKSPFCVKVEQDQFSPLASTFVPFPNEPAMTPWEKSKKIWLLVDSGSEEPSSEVWDVSVEIEKDQPHCLRCDSDCMKPGSKQNSVLTQKLKFSSKNSARVLIDVTRDIKDWRFMGLSMKAEVEGPLSTFRSSQSVRGWPWCRPASANLQNTK